MGLQQPPGDRHVAKSANVVNITFPQEGDDWIFIKGVRCREVG